MITRRSFFGFLAAPAIIKVADLMPISVPKLVAPTPVNMLIPDQFAYGLSQEEAIKLWARKLARETLRKTYIGHFRDRQFYEGTQWT